ncbi:putative General negative regulator of transcription subunit 1 [Glarea lozoyensis 74030]|uniref:General negative regulator of transcription subunit 1 n=1 Tax=Glarea lozoyensis (strain ATCC 74030 / MF5533) TaxID=1104152 RepID=H0EE95_GLAL7|nr:putative General negative regulator of transcription subunit 1 [Glarea lozoyensis 74030]
MVNSRGGTFTPSPAQQTIVTGVSHSPHGSHHGAFSAGASPSTSSPTGSNSLTKIVVAQVYLLLSTIKEDKDRTKWEEKAEQLRKLINDHGMEVFQKTPNNAATYPILCGEIEKIGRDVEQARKIAESIEAANEDIYRDFDLSTFMQHFHLDALEKTILALAFKIGSRPDLKTKSDAILAANFIELTKILAQQFPESRDMAPEFLATIIDRFIQEHPPNFDQHAKDELIFAINFRYTGSEAATPTEILAALYLLKSLGDRNTLVHYLKLVGSKITQEEDTCIHYLRAAKGEGVQLNEEQVAAALIYAAISQTPVLYMPTLVNSIRKVVSSISWPEVIRNFDQESLRITPKQFLALYNGLRPLAQDGLLDIQHMWGGKWRNPETQLSFIGAFLSLTSDQLDATTIPNLQVSFTLEEFTGTEPETYERAAKAVKHPLVSSWALSAMFNVALEGQDASETIEAKRLFQGVVVPNLDIFLVSAFGVPKPWPDIAVDTINTLFNRFLYKYDPNYDFVCDGLWKKDKSWVAARLVDAHAKSPMDLPLILDHAIRHNWLEDLVSMLSGFGLDLTALAHARGRLDLKKWIGLLDAAQRPNLSSSLITFLSIKARHELDYQKSDRLISMSLPVKTIYALLTVLREILDTAPPEHELIIVQRQCITAYPRLINYGEGFDDVIDKNGESGNLLPRIANERMEEHYKRMYNQDLEVRQVVEALRSYKRSQNPEDQDIFACMIHGLFDEYDIYSTYPLDALATTAVLFGGIIQHNLISNIPLEVGLGMILEAVKPRSPPSESMFKFGLQALIQMKDRLSDWPGFCNQLLQIPGLQNTEVWTKAEEVWQATQEQGQNGLGNAADHQYPNGGITDNNIDEMLAPEPSCAPFNALWVDDYGTDYDVPNSKVQEEIQFLMNNVTAENLEDKYVELRDMVAEQNQQWFASQLVEQRAKREPNNHQQYLNLIKLIGSKTLWSDILHETYVSAFRLLNSESVLHNQNDRTLLINLAIWLGSLTLARDKPIKHQNIAFKQLLMEAFDTKRLIAVIPFVCKVMAQGQHSTVFKPPNPWVMDIIQLLMELYHHAPDVKLNQKFAIEVLCSDFGVNHEAIETSGDILNRAPIEEATEVMSQEVMDRFENLAIIERLASERFSPEQIARSLPDLGPDLILPPPNDMVNQARLHEILRTAISRAVAEIISPVVERSVTIAAISTAQMIHKDFATEPDEERVRAAAINMVKKTAGSLALVTSKEPLRASMTNYIRSTSGELSQGLAEGTIIMCVNQNLELACKQVENKAEERAVPEIEEMMENELERRRQHRLMRPEEPYIDPELSRWSWTIPSPYKLRPNRDGLNEHQMAIYDEFARQPRPQSISGTAHVATSSDATRSMANEILQDQYSAVPHLTGPTEPPAMAHASNHQLPYAPSATTTNGRLPNMPQSQMESRLVTENFEKTLMELKRVAAESSEEHYKDLPRPNPVVDFMDALFNLIVRCSGTPAELDIILVDTAALIEEGLLEWQRVDSAISKAIQHRKEEALEFLLEIVTKFLCNDNPSALYTDLARSLEVAWNWIDDAALATPEVGQKLRQVMKASAVPQHGIRSVDDRLHAKQEQMAYVFDSWVRLYDNSIATEKSSAEFIEQMFQTQLINDRDDLLIFLRQAIDSSVEKFEHLIQTHLIVDAYVPIDALAKLVSLLVKRPQRDGEVKNDRAKYLGMILSLAVFVLNYHHLTRGEAFNQRVFARFFSALLIQMKPLSKDELSELECRDILLVFARNFLELDPSYFPGFVFQWFSLISHRDFMPNLLRLPEQEGWEPFAKIMETLLTYVGDLLKPIHLAEMTKRVYGGVLKILVVLQHDFPDFVSANHSRLCAKIPSHCIQLHNLILNANPVRFQKMPDPLQPGLKVDRIEEMRTSPQIVTNAEEILAQSDLLELLNKSIQQGPSEDVVAQISHTIQRKRGRQSSLGFTPINVDRRLIEALIIHVGMQAIAKAEAKDAPTFAINTSDTALFKMLVHELQPEARYYFLSSMVDQLRYPNSHTHYFSQALLNLFGSDMNDQEESDIRQQITRVLLERLAGQWPQPWGLIVTIHELVKNDQYMFFELPFIKSATPDVAERFAAIAARPYPSM